LSGILLVSLLLQWLLRREVAKQGMRIAWRNLRQNAKMLYKFAIPASLSTLIVAPTLWALNTMLVNQPAGYPALGLYTAVMIFGMAIQLFNGAIGNALLPILLSKTEHISPAKAFFNYFGPWLISIALALPILLFPELIPFVLGPKYSLHSILPLLGPILLSTFIIASRGGIARDLIVQNRMWLSVFSMGQWALTTLIAFHFLRDQGATGFAFSFAIGYAINYLLLTPFFIRWKIAPAYVFYAFPVHAIWVSLLGFLAMHRLYFEPPLLRISISLLLLVILSASVHQLYRKCLKE
jgi:O-antigen/teichoic acid export membrane protein